MYPNLTQTTDGHRARTSGILLGPTAAPMSTTRKATGVAVAKKGFSVNASKTRPASIASRHLVLPHIGQGMPNTV